MRLLYFIRCDGDINADLLRKAGFPHADHALLPGCLCEGPRGRGYCFTTQAPNRLSGDPIPLGYYPGDQKWVDAGRYWIGWFTASRPTPQDVVLADCAVGHPVTLLDGNTYIVPVVRAWPGEPALGAVFGFDDGQPVLAPRGQALELFKRALLMWSFSGMVDPPLDLDDKPGWDDCFQYVADVLAYAYRISADDLRALELLDEAALRKCILASLDMSTYIRIGNALAAKKKLGATGELSRSCGASLSAPPAGALPA